MLSGSLGGARVIILENRYKKEERHPDFNLFIVESNREGGAEIQTGPIEDDLPS